VVAQFPVLQKATPLPIPQFQLPKNLKQYSKR
jgi:hypothetical protein